MVIETGGWTTLDELAGVLAVLLTTGYYVVPVQYAVATVLNVLLGPLATLVPFSVFLLGLSGATGIVSSVLQVRLRDAEALERLQERTKELQERLQDAQGGDAAALADEQHEFVDAWKTMLKLQFRPMVWSMLLTVPTFLWLRWAVTSPAAFVPAALSLPASDSWRSLQRSSGR
ncbi:DUF106 domain-containing protein [Halomicrococcus gelatinilyticus]|uniref:DUF106 domain-containing protein n=1 Tax=Halomicrococcus gelatinilyticus TaxID=1702103 RepID=UPI002E14DD1E